MKIAFVFDGLGFGGIERVGIDYIKLCLQMGHEVDVYNLSPQYNALVEQLPSEVKYFKKKLSKKLCPELYSYGVQKAWWGKYAYAMLSPFISFAQVIKKLFPKSANTIRLLRFRGISMICLSWQRILLKRNKKYAGVMGTYYRILLFAMPIRFCIRR